MFFFVFSPKSKLFSESTPVHVHGLSGNGQELWWTSHIGLWVDFFFSFSALCFEDTFLLKMTVFCVIVALHIGTVNVSRAYKSHCFWTCHGKMNAYFSVHSSLKRRFLLSTFIFFDQAILTLAKSNVWYRWPFCFCVSVRVLAHSYAYSQLQHHLSHAKIFAYNDSIG